MTHNTQLRSLFLLVIGFIWVRIRQAKILVFYLSLATGLSFWPVAGIAQSTGNAGSITGTVSDPTEAVVPGATVQILNPVSEYSRTATTDSAGKFSFPNVPLNAYHLSVASSGFSPTAQDVEVRSSLPVSLSISLQIGGAAETLNVQGEAGDLLETSPTFHTDVDRSSFDRLPWKAPPRS